MNTAPIMPKATAVWLIENTSLTFEQIAAFCQLHLLEIQALADSEQVPFIGDDPIVGGQVTAEDIKKCEQDPTARLTLCAPVDADAVLGKKKSRYLPLSKRQDRPNAIAWLLKNHPELSDKQICRLVGTTKPTVMAIREKTYRQFQDLKPRSPVQLELCTQQELETALESAPKKEEGEDKHGPTRRSS